LLASSAVACYGGWKGGCACRLEKNACDRRASDISLALPEVTGVIFKMTSPKKFHPRYAVGLFSRVCTTRTLGKMYRCEQEKVCQTLENKTTSTERHRCHLEKNGRDRRAQGFQESRQLRFLARRSLLAKAAALCAMHLNPRTARQAHGPEPFGLERLDMSSSTCLMAERQRRRAHESLNPILLNQAKTYKDVFTMAIFLFPTILQPPWFVVGSW
jgi:hypothetical protein